MQMASSSSALNPNQQQQMNNGPISTNYATCLLNGLGPDTLSLLNQAQAMQTVVSQLDNLMNATSQLQQLAFSGNLLLNHLLSQQLLGGLSGGVITASNSSVLLNTTHYNSQGLNFTSQSEHSQSCSWEEGHEV